MNNRNIILICFLSMLFVGNLSAQKCSSKSIKVCPDTIVGLTQYISDTTALKAQIKKLQQSTESVESIEKFNPEIDKFLNREDVSIFNNNFMDLTDNDIHPRSQSYCHLIKNVRALENLLSKNDLTTIRADLEKMGELINVINNTEKSPKNLLPIQLLDYYKSLVKKYGEIYNNIYPNE